MQHIHIIIYIGLTMLGSVITALLIVGLLTSMLASVLIFASRRFYVAEDKRLSQVENMLPHNNCGACGFPSCHMFAEALVENKAQPAKCSVSSEQEKNAIAIYLNVDKGHQVIQVARLACAGGRNVARVQAEYTGLKTCAAASTLAGGGKSCFWGCLGWADCARACTFDAITMDNNGLPVVAQDKCTACGDCVVACPKELFSLRPVEQALWVNCRNLEQGDELLQHCEVACTACGKCVHDAPSGVLSMDSNLPHIHIRTEADWIATKQDESGLRKSIERCPTGAIVWFTNAGLEQKGMAAKPVKRHSALQAEET